MGSHVDRKNTLYSVIAGGDVRAETSPFKGGHFVLLEGAVPLPLRSRAHARVLSSSLRGGRYMDTTNPS